MKLQVLLSPTASGKTDWAVNYARDLSSGLSQTPRIIVPSHIQVQDCKKRLAEFGGALGVKIITFEELAWQIIEISGYYPGRLSENDQGVLIRDQLGKLDLEFFNGIKSKLGFTQNIHEIIRELKAGRILPDQLILAINETGISSRLLEIAEIYLSYQDRLGTLGMVDPIGAVNLAGERVTTQPDLYAAWDTLIFDGFDDLSPGQLHLLAGICDAVESVYFTLTGGTEEMRDKLVHKRSLSLLKEISSSMPVEIRRLEDITTIQAGKGAISALRSVVFSPAGTKQIDPGEELSMAAVPDRQAEVRTALRWIRKLIIEKKINLDDAAIIMRSQESYRSILGRIASEFGLQIRIQGGLPLSENPLISTILALLRIGNMGDEGLTWRDIVDNWQAPYFNWAILYQKTGKVYDSETHSKNSNLIKDLAQWGSVVGGYTQWADLFSILLDRSQSNSGAETQTIPADISQADAADLWDLLCVYIDLISPPVGELLVEEQVSWVEDLIGISANDDEDAYQGLNCLEQVRVGSPAYLQRDWKAIRVFHKILRDQVSVSRLLNQGGMDFNDFLVELIGVVEKTSYQPLDNDQRAITCADVSESRGLAFEAVALLGLSEGEFPATINEDPFLRDLDRTTLSEGFNLPLKLSTESAEAEYFYEAISRSKKYLLLTRPRIADNGTPWQPSPYWEEIQRWVNLAPRLETSRSKPELELAGSLAEYFEVIAGRFGFSSPGWQLSYQLYPEYSHQIVHSSMVLKARTSGFSGPGSEYDGGLSKIKGEFSSKYSSSYVWSASRLETYQSCPFQFFVTNVLNLDQTDPPQEGLDARQLGNIYHHVLEDLYRSVDDSYTLPDLLAALPGIAEVVFDAAPPREGFRKTAWWDLTKQEILANVERSVIVLETLDPSYRYYRAEQKFGIGDQPELIIQVPDLPGESYRMRGFIDRIDIKESGELRIIDYKTSGSFGFNNFAVKSGKKLQLPIYALAAMQALDLGSVREGFYFHVRSSEPSPFKLASYREGENRGPRAAIDRTIKSGWLAVQSIRNGEFRPQPPESGCPEYCPAAEFCWFYQPRQW